MGELPRVVVVGAASIDTKGRARGELIPATSNPSEIRVSAGSVGRLSKPDLQHCVLLDGTSIPSLDEKIAIALEPGYRLASLGEVTIYNKASRRLSSPAKGKHPPPLSHRLGGGTRLCTSCSHHSRSTP